MWRMPVKKGEEKDRSYEEVMQRYPDIEHIICFDGYIEKEEEAPFKLLRIETEGIADQVYTLLFVLGGYLWIWTRRRDLIGGYWNQGKTQRGRERVEEAMSLLDEKMPELYVYGCVPKVSWEELDSIIDEERKTIQYHPGWRKKDKYHPGWRKKEEDEE